MTLNPDHNHVTVTSDNFGRIVVYLRDGRCEDCEIRSMETGVDTLREDGAPAYHPQLGFRLTTGCDGCGGSGSSTPTPQKYIFEENILHTRLTLKERFVLERRLGLTDGKKYQQKAIAEALGMSRSGIAKLEQRAREKLGALARKVYVTQSRHVSTSRKGQNLAGEAQGQVTRRRSSSTPYPQQRTTGSRSTDVYFAGSKNSHTYERDS